ncbi:MAG TPA: response regulator [Rhodoferax sp.]|nr:response regulator [Rhodoferax sp.]
MEPGKERILIVDDDVTNIMLLKAALWHEYDIDTATGGQEAISRVQEHPPELILLDVMMPDLSGFDVCSIIKSSEKLAHIPIIFLTGMDTLDGEIRGLEAGGIDYLTKPVNIELVKLRVRNHLELNRRSEIIRQQRDLLEVRKQELEATLARMKRLEGIIHICMRCKKIRDDGDSWRQLEQYISEHTDALFSHGLCPSCCQDEMKLDSAKSSPLFRRFLG